MRLVELKDVRLRNEGLGRYFLEDFGSTPHPATVTTRIIACLVRE